MCDLFSYSDRAFGQLQGQVRVLAALKKIRGSARQKYTIQVSVQEHMKTPLSKRTSTSSGFLQETFSVEVGDIPSRKGPLIKVFLPASAWRNQENGIMVFQSGTNNQAFGCFLLAIGEQSSPSLTNFLIVFGIYDHKVWTDILDDHEIQSQVLQRLESINSPVQFGALNVPYFFARIQALYGTDGRRRHIPCRHFTTIYKSTSFAADVNSLRVETKPREHLKQAVFHIKAAHVWKDKAQNVSNPDELTSAEIMAPRQYRPLTETQRAMFEVMRGHMPVHENPIVETSSPIG